jgi:hypothetical protein
MTDSNQQKFWKNFAKFTWEKKPRLLKKFASPLIEIKEDRIFSMLVEYSDYCRKIKNSQGFKFYLDGQRQHEEDILQILPVKKDKSLLGYHTRMQEMFSDYCLVCDELLQVSQADLVRLQEFTDNLFSHVGFPNRFAEMGLYLGNYRKTPFGVHVDGCGVFSFPVVGEKTFRLWKPDFVKKNPSLDRADHYARFKKHSETLKAFPGDVTYWPSSAWHIAESDGSFSATWSLGVWVDLTHQENLEGALRPLLKSKLKTTGGKTTSDRPPIQKNGQASLLPKNYLDSISELKAISENELHDALLKTWITLNSKQGFKTSPRTTPQTALSFQSRIRMTSPKCVLWSQLKSEAKIIYAFQGTLLESLPSIELLKLIKALNLGHQCLIRDYLTGPKRKQDLKSLQVLSTAGAFVFP